MKEKVARHRRLRETAPGHSQKIEGGEVDLRLEKVVASKQLRLAAETEEERRTRLEAFMKSLRLCLSFKLDVLTT